MQARPVVSVVLPVFNGGALFQRAVGSILRQTHAEFELIILDDASTDGSGDRADDFARQDPRVRVLHHMQNKGVAVTLNEGIEIAEAPLVARMDADDESLPRRLEAQVAFMGTHPDIAVAGSFVFHMGARPRYDHLITLPTSYGEIRETLQKYNCLYHPTVIFRKSIIQDAGGYRAEFVNAEDYDLWLRISRTHHMCNIPEPLLRYRFTLQGATLGRKWQQLYYVYLAQVVNADQQVTMSAARSRADEMLRQTDRRYFLGEVSKGTVDELLRLRLWRQAAQLLVTFENDIDPVVYTDLARNILHAAVPEAPPI